MDGFNICVSVAVCGMNGYFWQVIVMNWMQGLSHSLIDFQNGSLNFYLVSLPVSPPHSYYSVEKWLLLLPSYQSLISGYKSVKHGEAWSSFKKYTKQITSTILSTIVSFSSLQHIVYCEWQAIYFAKCLIDLLMMEPRVSYNIFPFPNPVDVWKTWE